MSVKDVIFKLDKVREINKNKISTYEKNKFYKENEKILKALDIVYKEKISGYEKDYVFEYYYKCHTPSEIAENNEVHIENVKKVLYDFILMVYYTI